MESFTEPSAARGSSNSSAKRKGSFGAVDETRVIRRRAARACLSCRNRKVRCDMVLNGDCCTNCNLDNLKCILTSSRRGRGDANQQQRSRPPQLGATSAPPNNSTTNPMGPGEIRQSGHTHEPSELSDTAGTQPNTEATFTPAQQHHSVGAAAFDGRQLTRMAFTPAPTPLTADEVTVGLTFDEEEACDGAESHVGEIEPTGGRHSGQPQRPEVVSTDGSRTQDGVGSIRPPSYSSPLTTSTGRHSASGPQLPGFIKALPTRLDPEALTFLTANGVFNLPDPELRAEILQSYICSVHTFMPIVDLCEFIEAVSSEECSSKISLLLFHAVMFAGLASLRPGAVQRTGCSTVKQARKAFFAKVRLLYDFDTEPDDIVVLQSLLLMSTWYDRWDDRKHTWYWTGQAVSLAQIMGLHRDIQGTGVDHKTQRLRRRLWWSLYIRDRLIALGTRRPLRIKDDEFDVPMLTVEDFGPVPAAVLALAPFASAPISHDAGQDRVLALMCIALAGLCTCIGRVLSSQYTVLGARTLLTSSLFVVPRSPDDRAEGFERCEEELQAWYSDLQPDIRRVALDLTNGAAPDSLAIPWSILHMIYLTTVSLLYRPRILQPYSRAPEAVQTQISARARIKDVARKLTKLLHTMLRRDQVHFLPTSGIPALLSAGLGHMADIKSKDEDTRDASIFRFYQTMQVLQRLRSIYASADAAVHFLASAVRKSGLTVPIQWPSQPAPAFMTAGTMQPTKPSFNVRAMSSTSLEGEHLGSAPGAYMPPHGQGHYVFPEYTQHHQTDQSAGMSQPPASSEQYIGPVQQGAAGNLVGRSETREKVPSTFYDTMRPVTDQAGTMLPTQEVSPSNFLDSLSIWAIDENLFTTTSSQGHVPNEEPVSLYHDFCSDVFGLLDGTVPDVGETSIGYTSVSETIMAAPGIQGD